MKVSTLLFLLLWSLPLAAADKLDVTFIVTADTHVVHTMPVNARNHVKALAAMKAPDGARLRWPEGLTGAGTTIPQPEAVFIAGDLSYDGNLRKDKPEWKMFYDLYLDPNRPMLPTRVFPGAGNHDTWMHLSQYLAGFHDVVNFGVNDLIEQSLTDKRVVSRFVPDYRPTWWNPPHYAVELGTGGRLLVVQLNTSIGEPCRAPKGLANHGLYLEPWVPKECDAYGWLRRTLQAHRDKHGADAPIILIQHYGYDEAGSGMNEYAYRGYWWAPEYRKALADTIQGYNVIALIHGHSHGAQRPEKALPRTQPTFTGGDIATVTDPGIGARVFTNFGKEKPPEFCRLVDASGAKAVRCTSIESSPTIDAQSLPLDEGWPAGRGWIDLNGDGRADYCRIVKTKQLTCRLSKGLGFGDDTAPYRVSDDGWENARWWVMLARNKPAFCRLVGSRGLVCTTWNRNGFDTAEIGASDLDQGYVDGRAFVDVNNDGLLDYCRPVKLGGQTKVQCRVSSNGAFFANEITSEAIDHGYEKGRGWVDVNGDGRADYCRVMGGNSGIGKIGCLLVNDTGTGFGKEIVSPFQGTGHGYDVGFEEGRTWADFDGDGKADYCRVVEANSGDLGRIECALAGGGAFVPSIRSLHLNPGTTDRTFADVNGDGRADFCRVRDKVVACTLAATLTTAPPVPSIGVAYGACHEEGAGGYSVFRVTDDRLEVVEVAKAATCDQASYDGGVSVAGSYVIRR